MQGIVVELRALIEASLDENGLAARNNAAKVKKALDSIETGAESLSRHMSRSDARFLALILQKHIRWLQWGYDNQRWEVSDDLLRRTIEVCIACHTRLPSEANAPRAQQFISSERIQTLSPAARARLFMATRRFSEAKVSLEQLLMDPRFATLDLYRDYLVLTLQVQGDEIGARSQIERMLRESPIDDALSEQLKAALAAIAKPPPSRGSKLDNARSLVERGEDAESKGPRFGLVDYLRATRILNHFLLDRDRSDEEKAEAFYLLGITSETTVPSTVIPQAEFYFERAILLAPKAPWAADAWWSLRARMVAFFGDIPDMPDDVVQRLQSLENMVDF